MYQANIIANYIIDQSQKGKVYELTNMKMQRMLFIIEAWHREIYKVGLIQDIFSMWNYGPVLPGLHYLLKLQNSEYISQNIYTLKNEVNIVKYSLRSDDIKTTKLIDKIIEISNVYTGTQLSNIILNIIPPLKEGEVISDDIFLSYIKKTKSLKI